jgi:transcriptional regulator with XRE-family HTH domain
MDRKLQRAFARSIGRRLRAARTVRGLDVEVVAARAGVNAARLRRYEAGNGRMTIAELEKLAAALHLPAAHFLGACMLCGSDATP